MCAFSWEESDSSETGHSKGLTWPPFRHRNQEISFTVKSYLLCHLEMSMTVMFIIIVSVVKIKFCQWIRFPDNSVGKESACNAGDPGLIPGLGRSSGEGIGYSLQNSWALLVAHLVKNPSAMPETWVWSLGWEDPLEEGTTTHSNILAWKIPGTVQSMASHTVWQYLATFMHISHWHSGS